MRISYFVGLVQLKIANMHCEIYDTVHFQIWYKKNEID